MSKKILTLILSATIPAVIFSACSSQNGASMSGNTELKDGEYRAEYKDYDDHGWKDYVTITVSDGKYTACEYDAVNKDDGRKKSEDKEYASAYPKDGGYVKPEEYTTRLEEDFIEKQNISSVDVIATATNSSESFKKLVGALEVNIKRGKTDTVIIDNNS